MVAVPGWLAASEPTVASVSSDYSYCTVCHGSKLAGNQAIAAPALAGIEPWYLTGQIKSFRDHQRGENSVLDPAGAEMGTVARELGDERIDAIQRYINRLSGESKGEPRPVSVTGNAANGQRLYAAHCVACHGAHAEGNVALHAPSLARLNDWYIVASFRKFQSGGRGTSADQMRQIAAALPNEFPINDVSSYLMTLHNARKK